MPSDTQVPGYWTLEEPHSSLTEIKKSKFFVHAWPISTPQEALSRIEEAREPGASHNCWAFRAGGSARSNDDGEPGGTAGRPILAAIENSGLDYVCVLVVRYFGGIKLGSGGLVRAYGGSAQECLKEARRVMVEHKVAVEMDASFDSLGAIYALMQRHKAEGVEESYTAGGRLRLKALVPSHCVDPLAMAISNATSGGVLLQVVKEEVH